jgi:hypothetical protein
MIGNLNKKIFFLLIGISLLFSCERIEKELEPDDISRYTVVERKTQNTIGPGGDYKHRYYLLDTKTGELKEINWIKDVIGYNSDYNPNQKYDSSDSSETKETETIRID